MRCAAHPDVETNLRCGKCGKPICPRCTVQTPVGFRCPDCARLYRLPTYRVSTRYYLRAAGAGLGLAAITGIVWGALAGWLPFNLNLILAPGVGYAIGELMSLSINRKRGTGLAIIAGAAVAIGYLVSLWFSGFLFELPFLWAFNPGIFRLVIDLVALALGISVAVSRLR